MLGKTIELVNAVSSVVALVSAGTFYGIIFIWDEIKAIPNYDEFIQQINTEMTLYLVTLSISVVAWVMTTIYLKTWEKEKTNEQPHG